MQKSKIEWTNYTWNPITGCDNNCPYCYARRIATRFNGTKAFPDGFKPTFHEDRLGDPAKSTTGTKIFTCSMGELFNSNHIDWTRRVIDSIRSFPEHTFQLLTKNAHELWHWSPFPDNCWVGATATDYTTATHAMDGLSKINAKVKFISFEPIKSVCTNQPVRFARSLVLSDINWIILGQETPIKESTRPIIEWVHNIVESADIAQIPIFIKDNLRELLPALRPFYTFKYHDDIEQPITFTIRQEFPIE